MLTEATTYGAVIFSGALMMWLSNTLASVLRGTGNMRVPSITIVSAALLQIALGGLLGLGVGDVPSFGVVGVAVAAYGMLTAMSVKITDWKRA